MAFLRKPKSLERSWALVDQRIALLSDRISDWRRTAQAGVAEAEVQKNLPNGVPEEVLSTYIPHLAHHPAKCAGRRTDSRIGVTHTQTCGLIKPVRRGYEAGAEKHASFSQIKIAEGCR